MPPEVICEKCGEAWYHGNTEIHAVWCKRYTGCLKEYTVEVTITIKRVVLDIDCGSASQHGVKLVKNRIEHSTMDLVSIDAINCKKIRR